jgi:hypothetical protein
MPSVKLNGKVMPIKETIFFGGKLNTVNKKLDFWEIHKLEKTEFSI